LATNNTDISQDLCIRAIPDSGIDSIKLLLVVGIAKGGTAHPLFRVGRQADVSLKERADGLG
jgi:hypothetical protein